MNTSIFFKLFAAISFAIFAVSANSQRTGRGPEIQSDMRSTGGAPTPKSFNSEVLFDFSLDDWSVDHQHLRGPTTIRVQRDGTAEIKIAHISNMQRYSGGFQGAIDQGPERCLSVRLDFYDNDKCTGRPVHSMKFLHMVCLEYKHSKENFIRTTRDSGENRFTFGNARCADHFMAWTGVTNMGVLVDKR